MGSVRNVSGDEVAFGVRGEVAYDEVNDLVQCHLCGRWLKRISGAHLRHRHALTVPEYRDAFGLAATDSLMARSTREKHRTRTIQRLEDKELGSPLGNGGLRAGKWTSAAADHPQLSREFDQARNGDLSLSDFGVWSVERVWWKCEACGHQWRSSVSGRASHGTGCPACGPRHAAKRRRQPHQPPMSERSLAAVRPDLTAQLAPGHNPGIDPEQIGVWAKQKLTWRCATCGHIWSASVQTRHQGTGCPVCARAARRASYAQGQPQ